MANTERTAVHVSLTAPSTTKKSFNKKTGWASHLDDTDLTALAPVQPAPVQQCGAQKMLSMASAGTGGHA